MFGILHHFLQAQTGSGDLSYCAILWVLVIIALGLTLLNTIAMINIKCQRLPTLVNSLNFGLEIDYDRWCVASHIAACDAGFFVYNVRLAPASVLKFGYLSMAVGLYLISRMVKLE
ncbi:unnamed protein product [Amoebophrya sp. A120]|nr:unnamed protein product [Amoebophrya sp. A120]|eukprot:GSA120T00006115001.1